MPFGVEVGIGSCDVVLDADPARTQKGAQQTPSFQPILLWHGRPSQLLLNTCLKPNSITLASSELAPNMFGASLELVRS